jgi:mannose-6-phosphate isomerase-like protein (cupin superfamily)
MKLKRFLSEETSKGFDVRDIESETVANDNFRKVLYTGVNTQLVLMTLQPSEDIGNEVHKNVDQFFRIEEGEGKVVINEKEEIAVKAGSSIVIKQGTYHNIVNTSSTKKLQLYSLYSPPHHIDGTVHKTKEEAKADKKDEEFGNK